MPARPVGMCSEGTNRSFNPVPEEMRRGAPHIAHFAKGGNWERICDWVVQNSQPWCRRHPYPPLQKTQGRGTLSIDGAQKIFKRVGHPPERCGKDLRNGHSDSQAVDRFCQGFVARNSGRPRTQRCGHSCVLFFARDFPGGDPCPFSASLPLHPPPAAGHTGSSSPGSAGAVGKDFRGNHPARFFRKNGWTVDIRTDLYALVGIHRRLRDHGAAQCDLRCQGTARVLEGAGNRDSADGCSLFCWRSGPCRW